MTLPITYTIETFTPVFFVVVATGNGFVYQTFIRAYGVTSGRRGIDARDRDRNSIIIIGGATIETGEGMGTNLLGVFVSYLACVGGYNYLATTSALYFANSAG